MKSGKDIKLEAQATLAWKGRVWEWGNAMREILQDKRAFKAFLPSVMLQHSLGHNNSQIQTGRDIHPGF